MGLEGKVAIVTGASRGIGHFIALELARAGAQVAIGARSEQESNPRLPGTIYSVAEECSALGPKALPVVLDVTSDDSIAAGVARVIGEFGRVDLLVNNAGLMAPGPFHESPMKRVDLILRVNLRGPWAMAHEVIPHMLAAGSGVIVNISSSGADSAGAGNISYSVTKQADRKLAEGLAAEYGGRGIRAYSLSPEKLVLSPGALFSMPKLGVPVENVEENALMGQAVIRLFEDVEGKLNGGHYFSGPLLRAG